jgi:hypothetical protein
MRFVAGVLGILLAVSPSQAQGARDELEEIISDAPPLIKPEKPAAEKARTSFVGTLNDHHLLLVGLRMDAAYTGGGLSTQGFSIPSVRLTAWGQAGDLIGYRLSLGQTREFSTALLPQILPVEAYIDFNSASMLDWNPRSKLLVRLGLFTPSFNPWWSPDLADIPVPDYQSSHSLLFINRDIGAELVVEPIAGRIQFFAGMFNGSGIVGSNTNNAKAFTAGIRGAIPIGATKLTLGASAYLREQADSGSVNYRADSIVNLYTALEVPGTAFRVNGEVFAGTLNDSTRSSNPLGGALTLQVPVFRGFRIFTRAELVRGTGTGNGWLRNAQMGPVMELQKGATAYLFYQYLENGGSPENLGWLRVRLVL